MCSYIHVFGGKNGFNFIRESSLYVRRAPSLIFLSFCFIFVTSKFRKPFERFEFCRSPLCDNMTLCLGVIKRHLTTKRNDTLFIVRARAGAGWRMPLTILGLMEKYVILFMFAHIERWRTLANEMNVLSFVEIKFSWNSSPFCVKLWFKFSNWKSFLWSGRIVKLDGKLWTCKCNLIPSSSPSERNLNMFTIRLIKMGYSSTSKSIFFANSTAWCHQHGQ